MKKYLLFFTSFTAIASTSVWADQENFIGASMSQIQHSNKGHLPPSHFAEAASRLTGLSATITGSNQNTKSNNAGLFIGSWMSPNLGYEFGFLDLGDARSAVSV